MRDDRGHEDEEPFHQNKTQGHPAANSRPDPSAPPSDERGTTRNNMVTRSSARCAVRRAPTWATGNKRWGGRLAALVRVKQATPTHQGGTEHSDGLDPPIHNGATNAREFSDKRWRLCGFHMIFTMTDKVGRQWVAWANGRSARKDKNRTRAGCQCVAVLLGLPPASGSPRCEGRLNKVWFACVCVC